MYEKPMNGAEEGKQQPKKKNIHISQFKPGEFLHGKWMIYISKLLGDSHPLK